VEKGEKVYKPECSRNTCRPKNVKPTIVKEYDGLKTEVYVVKTSEAVLPRTSDLFEPVGELLILGAVKNNIRKAVILTNKELAEEQIDFRIRWALEKTAEYKVHYV